MRLAVCALLFALALAHAVSPPNSGHLSRFAERMKMRSQTSARQYYNDIAAAVATDMFEGFAHFSTYMSHHHLYYRTSAQQQWGQVIHNTDAFAIMGTAANLLGCRPGKGADLDLMFWGDMEYQPEPKAEATTENIVRVEVDNDAKHNYWVSKKGQVAAGQDTDARVYDDVKHFNPVEPKFGGPIEFDLWGVEKRVNDPDETMNKVRRRIVTEGKQALVSVDVPNSPNNAKVFAMPCHEQIRSKANLLLNNQAYKRQRKEDTKVAADHKLRYKKGKGKLMNDAGDVACLCSHPKCEPMRIGFKANQYPDVKRICEVDWALVSKMANDWTDTDYSAAARDPTHAQQPMFKHPNAPKPMRDQLTDAVVTDIVARMRAVP